MLRAISAFAAAGLVMLILDAAWLSSMAPTYRRLLSDLLLDGFRLGPAIAFYLLYVAGIVLMAVYPALREGGGWQAAALNGAILGLIAYGTYDLTNQATLKTWSLQITLMDMAWGTFLTAVSATAAAAVAGYAFPLRT